MKSNDLGSNGLTTLIKDVFAGWSFNEKLVERERKSCIDIFDKIVVMSCSGYDEGFREVGLVKIDLYQLEYFFSSEEKWEDYKSKIKDRYRIVNLVYMFRDYIPFMAVQGIDTKYEMLNFFLKD